MEFFCETLQAFRILEIKSGWIIKDTTFVYNRFQMGPKLYLFGPEGQH